MQDNSKLIRKNVYEMSGYVPGEQPADPGILKLNTNENPYSPSPRVGEAFERCNVADLRRYPDPQCSELRETIAQVHGVEPAMVFVGNGSDEVLSLIIRAFVENDGSVGFFDPSYSLYPVLAQAAGVSMRPVALGDDFEWKMPDGYEASVFFMTCPNAPTGIAYAQETVADFCRNFKGVVVIDEAYADFSESNALALTGELGNVLVCRTLSKSYSLAGLRVGYAIGHPVLIDALFRIKDSYNIGYLSQKLAVAALNDQAYMLRHAGFIRETRERVARELYMMGFAVTPSQANFLWVCHERVSARELFSRLREQKVLVRYFPGERTGRHLRITIGTDADMDRFLLEMRNALNQ